MRYYQHIVVNGRHYGDDVNSAFFNEGKWRHFVEPLLPEDCSGMTFVDFGCNCGLHLKLAQQKGFASTLGIESDKRLKELTSEYLGDSNQVLYREIDNNILRDTFIADLPASDFVLMANFHYHIQLPIFMHLVNLLRHKTRYCIVVSAIKVKRVPHAAGSDIDSLRRCFAGWVESGGVFGVPIERDPTPRDGMYSVAFQSNVERIPIRSIVFGRIGKRMYHKAVRMLKESGDRVPMTYPCLLRNDGSLTDGRCRLASAVLDGARTVLVERT